MTSGTSSTRSVKVNGRRGTELTVAGFVVKVLHGPDKGRTANAGLDAFRVGTAPGNDLVLADPAVSRAHLQLTLSDQGISIEDLQTKNGTTLDGVQIAKAFVREQGQLRIGDTILQVTIKPLRVVVFAENETVFQGMVSHSPRMQEIFGLVRQLAKHELPITICGETGTGKELVARALHESGPRAGGPFRVLDCGSLVKDLLASELFGHEKGAFTGADRARAGIFAEANGGTVFLDEVGEIDMSLQSSLLRVLETKEVSPLGSGKRVKVDFRLVSATHRDLRQMAAHGQFRSDLLFRLAAVTIELPTLRERTEDIIPLAEHFLTDIATRKGMPAPTLDAGAKEMLRRHSWPGNVRELRNIMDAAFAIGESGPVNAGLLRQMLRDDSRSRPVEVEEPAPKATTTPGGKTPGPVREHLDAVEKQAITTELIACGWNRTKAARRLGMSRSALYNKIERFGIRQPGLRDATED
jgi:DNA-binding NtrC family response regulator